ncbi:hypothetical protein [Nocardia jinanensis]|uniref:Uncharacterized protein n=1 Tax=Nocardia jinanensis TaxID=382504 RepID=A0A917VY44_9NOCA|nr:hypothetical protein [Nocardia jinanensis]GGL36904.1 hypothetical protein GCM10011588_59540 [Nocardia jinanensis]
MMALVWLIDILVIIVKILGGQMSVDPILRFGLRLALLCVLAAGLAVVGAGFVLLQQYLTGDLATTGPELPW